MTKAETLERLRAFVSRSGRRYRVQQLAVFGSTGRDEASDGSDVDVLVDFDGPADFDCFMDLKLALEQTLGCRVDLVTRAALRPALRQTIEREAVRVA